MKKTSMKIIAAVLCLIMAFTGTVCAFADSSAVYTFSVTYHQSDARSVLGRINTLRSCSNAWYWNADNTEKVYAEGLSELVYDYDLEKIAMQRAAEIIINFDHTRPNGEDFITAYNNNYLSAGENIAYGYSSASDVQTAFEEADKNYSGQGHRRNMLGSGYTAVGLACAEYNGVKFFVQEFRCPTGSTAYTAPNDSTASVNVEISSSLISSDSLYVNSSSLTVAKGSSASLPQVYDRLSLSNGRTINTCVNASWSSGNASVASVSGNTVYGAGSGSTSLKAASGGKSVSVNVTVTDDGSSGSSSGSSSEGTGESTGGNTDDGSSGSSWFTAILNFFRSIASFIISAVKFIASIF